jgi:dolichol-phosphate mannosyltransferase
MAGLFVFVGIGFHYLIANLFGIACAVLWNYLVNLKWTWSESSFGGLKLPPKTDMSASEDHEETVSVIIPTYNEAENIEKIVSEISSVFEKNDIKGEVLVVDDDSPDRTWEIAEGLASRYNVRVLRRTENKGLSPAVVDGFSHARGDIIGVMDADLSHPTDAIPDMIAPLKRGADLTVGSRYISGGDIENWPLKRKVISRGATMLARGLTKVKDPMSGFFFFRRSVIDGVRLNPTGYKIGLEVIVKGRHGRRIEEVPYVFKDREVGQSKLNNTEILNFVVHLARLYGHRVRGV